MTDEELKKRLRSAQVVPPTREATEDMMFRVRSSLRHRSAAASAGDVAKASRQVVFWRWVAGGMAILAMAMLVLRREGPAPVLTDRHIGEMRRYLGELQTLFPNRLDAVIFETDGPRLVLSESPGPSGGGALVLRLCAEGRCREVVTFSGRRIEIDGRKFEVLSQIGGGIIVMGDKGVWTSENPGQDGGLPFRIQARQLL